MANWNKTCNEFKEVRELINSDEYCGYDILSRLAKICGKYAKQDWDYAFDFEDLELEIEIVIEDKDYDDEDDIVNYYLGEFYDLCDDARVWLAI